MDTETDIEQEELPGNPGNHWKLDEARKGALLEASGSVALPVACFWTSSVQSGEKILANTGN